MEPRHPIQSTQVQNSQGQHSQGQNPQAPTPSGSDIYSEEAVWLCENRKTHFKTRIHGALAQILKKYPADYRLKLLFVKEPRHEQPASTGQ